jgi:N-methylhydantoinase A/oxoprolinase/acetone carboxylase beta subunit
MAGQRLAGPVIIEEETTTILLLPGHTATMDPQGNYLVAVD